MSGIEIKDVTSRNEHKAFIDLPWRIYEGDSNWIPPIRSEISHLLDEKKHPFWAFSEKALFLAMRDKTPVGRIAAIIDGNYNQYHNEKMGIWGFFECIRDPEVFVALFSASQAPH